MKITTRYNVYEGITLESGKIIFDTPSHFNGYLHDIINALQEDYPALFPSKPMGKLPLKIGIFRDLEDWAEINGVSKVNLRLILTCWRKGNRYRKALKFGQRNNVRFGLGTTGNDVRVYGYKEGETNENT